MGVVNMGSTGGWLCSETIHISLNPWHTTCGNLNNILIYYKYCDIQPLKNNHLGGVTNENNIQH
jgi:hypothetical protein